ncbi:unnamed protein product [Sphagnum balticum]
MGGPDMMVSPHGGHDMVVSPHGGHSRGSGRARRIERERESGFGLRESADSVVFLGCSAGASLQLAVKIEEERRGVQLGSCSLQKA